MGIDQFTLSVAGPGDVEAALTTFQRAIRSVSTGPGVEPEEFIEASGDRPIRNQTAYRYPLVQFEVEFLDENGDVMGSIVPVKRNLGVGETWSFEVPVRPEGAFQARMRNLTCSKNGEEPRPRACGIPPTLISLGVQ